MKLDIQKTLRQQKDIRSVLALTEEGKKILAKMPLDENGEIKLVQEYKNQLFLLELSQKKDLGFDFLEPGMEEKTLLYPYLNDAQWLADDEFQSIAKPEEYLDSVFQLERVLHSLEMDDIPGEIIEYSQERNKNRPKNIEKDLEYVLKEKAVINELPDDVLSIIESGMKDLRYQHHDVVPWHMARSGDRLILVDPGWAGISFKYYDFVYLMLQLVSYGNKKADAKEVGRRTEKEFGGEYNFKLNFDACLFYRYIKLSRELQEKGETKNLSRLNSLVKDLI